MNHQERVEDQNDCMSLYYGTYLISHPRISEEKLDTIQDFLNWCIKNNNESLDVPRKRGATFRQMDEWELYFYMCGQDGFLEAKVDEGFYIIHENLTYSIFLDQQIRDTEITTKPRNIPEAMQLANQHYVHYRLR